MIDTPFVVKGLGFPMRTTNFQWTAIAIGVVNKEIVGMFLPLTTVPANDEIYKGNPK